MEKKYIFTLSQCGFFYQLDRTCSICIEAVEQWFGSTLPGKIEVVVHKEDPNNEFICISRPIIQWTALISFPRRTEDKHFSHFLNRRGFVSSTINFIEQYFERHEVDEVFIELKEVVA